jgi:RHS repeat-associated protein
MMDGLTSSGQVHTHQLGDGSTVSTTTFGYDATHGSLNSIVQGTRTYQLGHDGNAYPSSVTMPNSQVVNLTHDPAGRLTKTTYPDLVTSVGLTSNLHGDVQAVTMPGVNDAGATTHATSWTGWNGTDLLSTYQPPGGGSTAYSYDRDGLLLFTAQPDKTLTTIPDAFGRTAVVSDPSTYGVSVTYGYDGADRLSRLVTSDGQTVAYTWDGSLLTQLAWTLGGYTASVAKQYGNDFRLTTETTTAPASSDGGGPATATTTLTYDADGLLATETLTDGQVSATLALVGTQPRDRQTGLVRSVNTTSGGGTLSEVYSYNQYGELGSATYTYGGATLYSVTYDTYPSTSAPRDPLGRVLTKSETIVGCTSSGCTGGALDAGTPVTTTTTYTYDTLLRLSTAAVGGTTNNYYYDSDGNRTCAGTPGTCGTAQNTYDAQDRLLSSGGGATTYGYTLNGTLASETVGSTTATFGYDLIGNLRSYGNGASSGNEGVSYTIDGANRRIGKSQNVSGTVTPVQQFIYRDARHIAAELDGGTPAGLVSAFSYGLREEVPDLMLRSGPSGLHGVYRIITDQLGSVRLVVNVATGVVVERIDYDEYGQPNVVYDALGSSTAFPYVLFQPLGFAGGMYDEVTGLVRFGARDYDASVGRWTSKDPIRFGGGWNLYAYGLVDPVNVVDRSGMDPAVARLRTICEYLWLGRLICGGAAMPDNSEPGPGPGPGPAPAPGPTPGGGMPELCVDPQLRKERRNECMQDCENQYDADEAGCRQLPAGLRRECFSKAVNAYASCVQWCNRQYPTCPFPNRSLSVIMR